MLFESECSALQKKIIEYRRKQVKRVCSFDQLMGVDVLIKRRRARIKASKKKRNLWARRLCQVAAFSTVFTTKKDPSVLKDTTTLDIGSITAVVENCATSMVLNNKELFVGGNVFPTNENSLITVGGIYCNPTHHGDAEISVRNYDGDMVSIPIQKALFFSKFTGECNQH